jgi:hypothetical protein
MSTSKTAGQAMREALDQTLGEGMEWNEGELLTLDMIVAAADRLASFRRRFEASDAKPDASPARLATFGRVPVARGCDSEVVGDIGSAQQSGEEHAARCGR